LRFGHGVGVPVYKAVTPTQDATPQEIEGLAAMFDPLMTRYQQLRAKGYTVDEADAITREEQNPPAVPATMDDWQNYVPEKTVEMDGGAVLSVDAKTGAAKGVKLARFDLVPMDALTELAEHYGKGEAKYPSDADGTPNWSKGYAWSKSTQAAMRHLAQFIGGEDVDAETGTKHVISVMWHMAALCHYMNTSTGTDDRWQA
jgi:hypothetical protein